ncbi:hypothetical protein HZS38_00190 [Xenorhabdus nematophila]|nr:hypothetical protein [Xenorhabdus nematophila]CEF30955.1 conserved hypothetical protein [Xenorhabdus nematophila str. Websteri]AYA39147.1 hypothetical protein D3790_00365 [Xenorhabdus nematophila]MBA0017720.1 hypothetical protein [Xenorhabdus nematophila]MCB4426846.1 hypothetical protein [Xenorhabdus nematophila]QNJ36793.1 hypothetical protein H8F46_00350 [Xenorhabdus nematophila]
MDDQKLYQKIGQLLVDAGPADAKKIIVRADLFSERNGCKYEFDYMDESEELGWFDPDAQAVSDLTDLLEELRNFFIENIQSQETPFWHGCTITLDVEKMKFSVEFKY